MLQYVALPSQDRLFSKYPMHSCNQLLWVTAWSAGFSLTALVTGGQLAPAVAFVGQHPACLGLILGLSALSTSAQVCVHGEREFMGWHGLAGAAAGLF